MPPWLPERGEFPILGERRLRDDQIDAIQRWVEGGQGGRQRRRSAEAAGLARRLAARQARRDRRPPRVRSTLSPSTDDVYRNLVLRTPLKADVFVRAVEFKTDGAPIHHAVIRVDRTQASRRRDGADGQPGFDGMSWQNVQDPDGQFIGWAPGRGPIVSPDGMPWRLERGADLVVELHLIPSKKPLVIQPTIGLFLSGTPPVQTPLTVKMGSKLIDIPAGQADYVVTDTYELPVRGGPDERVSARALSRQGDATSPRRCPDGAVKTLLHIQAVELPLAAGLPLRHADSAAARHERDDALHLRQFGRQRREPAHIRRCACGSGRSRPTRWRSSGCRCCRSRSPTPRSSCSRSTTATRWPTSRSARRACARRRTSAENRAFLGGSLRRGRAGSPTRSRSSRRRCGSTSGPPSAHSDLGTALMAQGDLADALAHLQRAAALAPRDESMPVQPRQRAQQARRALREAAAAYERALAINPDFPDAHVNLGTLLFAHGRVKDALPHFAARGRADAELAPSFTAISAARWPARAATPRR